MLSTPKRLLGKILYVLFGLGLGAFLGIILLLVLIEVHPSYETLVQRTHTAAAHGDIAKLRSLLKKDPNLASAPDEYGYPPIFHTKDRAVMEVLFDEGKMDIDITDYYGATQLSYAESKERAEFFIDRGADVNAKDNGGNSPLSWAILHRRKEVAELLAASGAEVDIFAACGLGMTERVRLSLEQDPNLVNATDLREGTLLHTAAAFGQLDVTRILIARGADIEHRNDYDKTPLFEAAIRGHVDVIELLLASGADAGAKDGSGRTAFDWAIDKGQNQAAELLRQH
ncbi:MAG: ankyrin repeat domain-containing protein [Planctomycetota bacterium]|jgi:ankyrin repeat protein